MINVYRGSCRGHAVKRLVFCDALQRQYPNLKTRFGHAATAILAEEAAERLRYAECEACEEDEARTMKHDDDEEYTYEYEYDEVARQGFLSLDAARAWAAVLNTGEGRPLCLRTATGEIAFVRQWR